MTHWFDVFLYELRQQMRRKSYLFITFVIPLLAIVAYFGYRAYQDTRKDTEDKPLNPVTDSVKHTNLIGLVDHTPDGMFPAPDSYPAVDCAITSPDLSAEVIKRITSPYCLRDRFRHYDSREAGEKALDDKTIHVLYVVEPDYADTGNVSMYMIGFNLEGVTTDQLMKDYLLASLLYDLDAEAYQSLYLRLRDPAAITQHTVAETGTTAKTNEFQNFIPVYAFGLILMMSIFWGGGYLMQSVVQEKESRIIEILLSSARPTALLAGKTLAMGLAALVQIATLIGAFLFIAGRAANLSDAVDNIEVGAIALALMVVYFVLGYLLFGSMMAAIGALSTTMRESQNFVIVVTLPAAIPFFFLTIFVEEPHSPLATALSIFPFTAPLSMAMRLSVTDVPAGQVALSVSLLIVAVAFTIWLSGRLFRVNTLLSGSMPRFKDIPKLLRG